MWTVKVKRIKYNRNGVMGEPFYSALIDSRIDKHDKQNLIATFTTTDLLENGGDNTVVIHTCRVINPLDITLCWRGDEFAREIQGELDKAMKINDKIKGVYDWMEDLNK